MAPIKFEEHVKEKLDEREIQPSAGSWDTLNSRLDSSNKNSGKKVWIPAVAAVMVLLIASILFIDQQDQNSTPIVETPVEKKVPDNSDNIEFEQPVQLASEESREEAQPKIVEQIKVEPVKKGRLASNNPQKRRFMEPINITPPEKSQEIASDYSGKMQGLLAKISNMEKESGSHITEAEVDALLVEAAKEISQKKNLYAQDKISPDALLAEAEEEIYQSFKEKVFEVLKDGYQKAAIAVSSKLDNNQNQ